jgi:hypothetical protein
MVRVFASGAVYRGFDRWLGQTRNKMCLYCFSATHATLMSKNNHCFAGNQDNVFKWRNMSTHGLLFQLAINIKIHFVLVQSEYHHRLLGM